MLFRGSGNSRLDCDPVPGSGGLPPTHTPVLSFMRRNSSRFDLALSTRADASFMLGTPWLSCWSAPGAYPTRASMIPRDIVFRRTLSTSTFYLYADPRSIVIAVHDIRAAKWLTKHSKLRRFVLASLRFTVLPYISQQ
ncbi:hypothetical protein ERJ75_000399100 [Trypanosoma vivax]|nr:hypothetical protein ERJ75_000399100 [Trypanosoma vivax]